MASREQMEQLLAELRRQREETEAEAGHAAEALIRLAGGVTPLIELDPEQVRASAETLADAIGRLRMLEEFARAVRRLLI